MSQRVWTCNCGWKSTAENVPVERGPCRRVLKGEAPAACRRCGSSALVVASEKHPQVTRVCKNPDCGTDFIGGVEAKYCQRCGPAMRGRNKPVSHRKYLWTAERDQILRDSYVAGRKGGAQSIAARLGWPKWAITHRAAMLGLARTKEKPWTPAEDAFITEWAGARTPYWMKRQRALTHRTVTAIIVRLKRLHVSRRIQDGMTMGQLEKALGVDHRHIAGWVRSGRLPAKRRQTDRTTGQGGDPYVFDERTVAAFILEHPSAFRLDRVDQVWFMGLMREAAGKRTPLEAAS